MHVNCKQIFSWTINNVMICRKNATSYCKYTYAEYIGICQKKHAHDQPKKHMIKKTDRILEQMQCRLCIMPFLEVTTCLIKIYIIPWENLDGHSNPIDLVLKPLKLQHVWRIFDRPVSSMYCKYAEYACKLQTFFFMNNKQCHNMQKNATSYCI